jgi:hypothetical protein
VLLPSLTLFFVVLGFHIQDLLWLLNTLLLITYSYYCYCYYLLLLVLLYIQGVSYVTVEMLVLYRQL